MFSQLICVLQPEAMLNVQPRLLNSTIYRIFIQSKHSKVSCLLCQALL
jgi:hypothetical protein